MKTKSEKYQNCIITLSDGSVHIFTGKAFSTNQEETRKVTGIQFTYPKPLPPGVRLSTEEELKGGKNVPS